MIQLTALLGDIVETSFANSLDAFIPEIWAQESLMILEANTIAAQLVHRDFEPLVARFGDTVNTRLPAEFKGARKADCENVTVQDAIATNVPVRLDQHIHASFIICDGEETKGFPVLRDVYLVPAMLACAQMVDEIILGQVYQFLTLDDGTPNVVGQLGVSATKQSIIAVREKMNINRAPTEGRHLIMTPGTEADLLAVDLFMGANQVGDDGSALREASLGKKYGIQNFMDQNTPGVSGTVVSATGAVNNVAGYAKGTTTMTVDGLSAALINGSWFTVAGDATPQRIISTVGAGTPTSITFFPGLSSAVVNDAVITLYESAAIDLVAGYASGWSKALTIDTATGAPALGQLISLGSGAATVVPLYSSVGGIVSPSTTSMLLNRPTAAAVANDDVVGYGPDGSYNLAFHRNAMALVTRPLAAPQAGTGALSFVASFKGLSMRVTITYDGNQQGHLVTCDMLCGVKVLDRRLGTVLLAA